MRKPLLAVLAVLVAAALPALATPCQVNLVVLRVPAASSALNARFITRTALHTLLQSGQAELIDSLSGRSSTDGEARIFAGQKIPLGFVDPRAGGYQVQYVDAGLKAAVKVHPDPSGKLLVEAKAEKMGLEDPGTNGLPYLQGVQTRTEFYLDPGQVALFARTSGHLSSALKLAWPGVSFADNDTVIFGLSVEP